MSAHPVQIKFIYEVLFIRIGYILTLAAQRGIGATLNPNEGQNAPTKSIFL